VSYAATTFTLAKELYLAEIDSALTDKTLWILDAHRDDRNVSLRMHEKLTAFLELERAVCIHLLTEQIK
jgi:hypothetical protein